MLLAGFILSLVAFLLFVRWDRKRIQQQELEPRSTKPGTGHATILLGFSAVSAALALAEYTNPSQPPFTGRGSSLKMALFEHFGAASLSLLYLGCSVVLLLLAGLISRTRIKANP